jgi:hypothetical protein
MPTKTKIAAQNSKSVPESHPAETWHEKRQREENAEAAVARVAVSKAAWELPDHDVINLWNFLELIEANEGGSATPVEDCIVGMPWRWKALLGRGRALTPDDMIQLIDGPDGCRLNFNDALDTARSFSVKYAKLMAGAPESASDAKEVL